MYVNIDLEIEMDTTTAIFVYDCICIYKDKPVLLGLTLSTTIYFILCLFIEPPNNIKQLSLADDVCHWQWGVHRISRTSSAAPAKERQVIHSYLGLL